MSLVTEDGLAKRGQVGSAEVVYMASGQCVHLHVHVTLYVFV